MDRLGGSLGTHAPRIQVIAVKRLWLLRLA
jgi:hypothetical protein